MLVGGSRDSWFDFTKPEWMLPPKGPPLPLTKLNGMPFCIEGAWQPAPGKAALALHCCKLKYSVGFVRRPQCCDRQTPSVSSNIIFLYSILLHGICEKAGL